MGSLVDPMAPHSKNGIWIFDGKDSSAKYNSPVSWSVSTQAARVKPSGRAWTDSVSEDMTAAFLITLPIVSAICCLL
eukprot:8037350-Ditylum_brightwellii.AAC.1